MEKYPEFGKLLNKLRDEHKWSQSELLEKLRNQGYDICSKDTVFKWEHGEH